MNTNQVNQVLEKFELSQEEMETLKDPARSISQTLFELDGEKYKFTVELLNNKPSYTITKQCRTLYRHKSMKQARHIISHLLYKLS